MNTSTLEAPRPAANSTGPFVIALTDAEREQLRDSLERVLTSGFDRKATSYVDAVHQSAVPVRIIAEQVFSSVTPYAVIRNLPVERLVGDWQVCAAPLTSAVLVGFTRALGLKHFGYPEEKKGAILQNVHPIAGRENTLSNAGRVNFNLHVESPFLPRAARPEAAALIAINNEAKTATRVAVVEKINARLPEATLEVLRQPLFSYRHDDSFEINGYTLKTPRSPFLKTVDGYEESRCAIFTNAHTPEAESALADWLEAAESEAFNVVLEPGDMLVFNNYRCIHGRGAVEGRRWLQRVYGSRDTYLADDHDLVSVWRAVGDVGIDHSF
jgi:hypothetical protein